ncbi:hypothetical protein [Myxococcus faecalis]|uniref:hypothetical protein n=1 Tax=Myxococcus faecalis TaxID=3115646 RepID=UPI003CEBA4B3
MTLSRWVIGFSALLLGACGGPAEMEEGVAPETTASVAQRSEQPGGGRQGFHRTYYHDAAKTRWAGALHGDCLGYITQSGVVTSYFDEYAFLCE